MNNSKSLDMWSTSPLPGHVCDACGANGCPSLAVWALCASCRGVTLDQQQSSTDNT